MFLLEVTPTLRRTCISLMRPGSRFRWPQRLPQRRTHISPARMTALMAWLMASAAISAWAGSRRRSLILPPGWEADIIFIEDAGIATDYTGAVIVSGIPGLTGLIGVSTLTSSPSSLINTERFHRYQQSAYRLHLIRTHDFRQPGWRAGGFFLEYRAVNPP